MQNYLGDGLQVPVTAPVSVVAGQPLLINSLFGICLAAAAEGQPVTLLVTGVFQLAKNAADTWLLGQSIYWDNTALLATSTAGGNTRIGVAIEAAANPSSVGNVRLNGSF